MVHDNSESHCHHHTPSHTGSGLTDPVCGMGVTADSAQHVEHAGKTYYFCSTKCMNRFQHDPEKFLSPT